MRLDLRLVLLGGALAEALLVSRAAAVGASPSEDPARLGRDVVPTFEALRLDLDPAKKGYSGTARIELQVESATDSFRLHAREMSLTRVVLRRGGVVIPTTTRSGEIGLLTVRARRPLAKGSCTLEIDFTNDFDTRATSVYRVEAGGHAYVFTDFEPDEARRAWPCFDEPSFKFSWQVTVTIPRGLRAVSNTLSAADTPVGAKRRITFHRTLPLPSYLMFVGVGPFQFAPIEGLSAPGRVVCTHGNVALAAPVVKETPAILAALERYFGRKYPYDKIDLIAVPEFTAGAMENAGAITYRENYLLVDPATLSPEQRRRIVEYTAHELSHMWHGDLVTMAWWNDLWLNESFATWLGGKITEEVAPEFRHEIDQVNDALEALSTDSRLTTRPVRAPFRATDNLGENFDVLSYQKGEAVLLMLERWLGAEKFRQGVRDYIAAHAGGNATAEDLWAALSKAAGQEVTPVATSFVEQAGVPVVTVEPLGGDRVRLSQRRFLNYGLKEPGRTLWRIPVTLRYGIGDRSLTRQVLLTEASQTIRLQGGTPAWIHPNAEEKGYYRWAVPAPMLAALQRHAREKLTTRERIGFVGNATALLKAGQLHGDQYLDALASFARDPEPEVVTAVLDGLGGIESPFLSARTRDDFAAYVRRSLGPALERIGMEPKKGESQPVALLRPRLLHWLADEGQDPRVLEYGRRLSAAYLKDQGSVDPSLQDMAVVLGALQGDAALLETYQRRFESAKVPAERARFLNGLGSFIDTTLARRALQYAVKGPLRPQEVTRIANSLFGRPELQDLVFEWSRANYDFIASRIPPYSVPYLPWTTPSCSLERLAEARAFFSQSAHKVVGTDKEMDKVEAVVRDCVSLHDREGAAAARYLAQAGRPK